MSEQTKVKKVRAYPIPATLTLGTANLSGQVVKLTPQGFLLECPLTALKPGDKFEIKFELPVLNVSIAEACVLVKVYSHWGTMPTGGSAAAEGGSLTPPPGQQATPGAAPASSKVNLLIEAHFQNASLQGKERINSFLNALSRSGSSK